MQQNLQLVRRMQAATQVTHQNNIFFHIDTKIANIRNFIQLMVKENVGIDDFLLLQHIFGSKIQSCFLKTLKKNYINASNACRCAADVEMLCLYCVCVVCGCVCLVFVFAGFTCTFTSEKRIELLELKSMYMLLLISENSLLLLCDHLMIA